MQSSMYYYYNGALYKGERVCRWKIRGAMVSCYDSIWCWSFLGQSVWPREDVCYYWVARGANEAIMRPAVARANGLQGLGSFGQSPC